MSSVYSKRPCVKSRFPARSGSKMAYIPNMNSPNPQRIIPSMIECLKAIRAPELYRNFAIPLRLLPAAIAMCAIASRMDSAWVQFPLSQPHGHSRLTLIGMGGLWVVCLWLPFLGWRWLSRNPCRWWSGPMVDTGPYTAIRHPSVLGKRWGHRADHLAVPNFPVWFFAHIGDLLCVKWFASGAVLRRSFWRKVCAIP